jgi:long-chain acyl-CoA synthetase
MEEFKPVIGYLALNQRVGILPIFLWGTYDAFPKGSTVPKWSNVGSKIGARVGRLLEYDELSEMTKGVPNTEAYRLIAARVQHEVENMRDGKNDQFDVKAVRKKWREERRKPKKLTPVIDD